MMCLELWSSPLLLIHSRSSIIVLLRSQWAKPHTKQIFQETKREIKQVGRKKVLKQELNKAPVDGEFTTENRPCQAVAPPHNSQQQSEEPPGPEPAASCQLSHRRAPLSLCRFYGRLLPQTADPPALQSQSCSEDGSLNLLFPNF
uniref:Uncharacterized protein n=1 Tax=Nothobranchius furzeri TaxID=105023 RepID=A0A1A8UV47_NOTFU